MGPDPENRVDDQNIGSQVGQFLLGCKCPVRRGFVQEEEEDSVGELLAACIFHSKCPSIAPAEISNTPR